MQPIADIAFVFFSLAAMGQLIVLSLLFARLAWTVPSQAPLVIYSPLPPISVIVCARNERQNLRQLIPLLLQQIYDAPWELILVDDASTDGSLAWLKEVQREHSSRMRIIQQNEKTQPGKKKALEQGILAAQYPNLALTDADCRPQSRFWLSEMALRLQADPECDIVLGYAPMFPAHGLLNAWSRYEVVHTATLYFSSALLGLSYMGVGRNLLWKKRLFAKTGGFAAHQHLASGDDDLFVNQAATRQNVDILPSAE